MGIRHSRQTTSLRWNRFYRRPKWPHCIDLSLFRTVFLKAKCSASMAVRLLDADGMKPIGVFLGENWEQATQMSG
jgi:hypothetical protein